jgi:hypothetical protein
MALWDVLMLQRINLKAVALVKFQLLYKVTAFLFLTLNYHSLEGLE